MEEAQRRTQADSQHYEGLLQVIDAKGRWVVPGLIDMHTHLTDRPGDTADLSVYYRRSREDQALIALENARVTLLAGFTTARDVGTYIAWADRDLRDAWPEGVTLPRAIVFNLACTTLGLPAVVQALAESERGLVLVAGVSATANCPDRRAKSVEEPAHRRAEAGEDLLAG